MEWRKKEKRKKTTATYTKQLKMVNISIISSNKYKWSGERL